MKYQDYYKILGVSRDAKQEEIAKAFRKLARQYHPDRNKNPGAEDQFKKINEAYEVLKDPEKRKRYDALGSNWKAGEKFRPPPGFENFSFDFGAGSGGLGGFSDFFQTLFGGLGGMGGMGGAGPGGARGRRAGRFGGIEDLLGGMNFQAGPAQGRDVGAEISISLQEAYRGGKKTVALRTADGETIAYDISIPAGIDSGQKIRLAGEGANGRGGMRGNLLLTVKVEPHPQFARQGNDLETDLPLAPWEAALGATLRVPTLDGEVELSVPAGSSSGRKLRLRGRGMPKLNRPEHGDLFAVIRIVLPKKLSEKEQEAYEALREASRFNPRER